MKWFLSACFAAFLSVTMSTCSIYMDSGIDQHLSEVNESLIAAPFKTVTIAEVTGEVLHVSSNRTEDVHTIVTAERLDSIAEGKTDFLEPAVSDDPFLSIRKEGDHYYRYGHSGLFVTKRVCDDDCMRFYLFCYEANLTCPVKLEEISGYQSVAPNQYEYSIDLGASEGIGHAKALEYAGLWGYDISFFADETLTIRVDFSGVDGSVLQIRTIIAGFTAEKEFDRVTLDYQIVTSFFASSDDAFVDFTDACVEILDARTFGTPTAAIGETIYGHIGPMKTAAVGYVLEPGIYEVVVTYEQGPLMESVRLLDASGAEVSPGVLTQVRVDVAGTYFVVLVGGSERSAIRIVLHPSS